MHTKARQTKQSHERPGVHEADAKHLRIGRADLRAASRAYNEAARGEPGRKDVRQKKQLYLSGGDALRGDTRSHPEHDG